MSVPCRSPNNSHVYATTQVVYGFTINPAQHHAAFTQWQQAQAAQARQAGHPTSTGQPHFSGPATHTQHPQFQAQRQAQAAAAAQMAQQQHWTRQWVYHGGNWR